MWLKADRAALATAALVGLSCWALWAPVTAHAGMPPAKQAAQQPAKAASVCPVRAHTTVRQIDLFDGPPADQAYLAPADPDRAPNLYPVRWSGARHAFGNPGRSVPLPRSRAPTHPHPGVPLKALAPWRAGALC